MSSRFASLRFLRLLLTFVVAPVLIFSCLISFFDHARDNARLTGCRSSLKQIGLGLAQYRRDFDDKFPPSTINTPPETPHQDGFNGPVGWGDAIQPYIKSTSIYYCPSENTVGNSSTLSEEGGYLDYWMNSHIARTKIRDAHIIMLGDGDGNGNANYAVGGLPANWQDEQGAGSWRHGEPPWFRRHWDGANYAFTDGHVKWLRPEQIGTEDWRFVP